MTKNNFFSLCWLIEPVHCAARGALVGDASGGPLVCQGEMVGTVHLLRVYRVEDRQK